MAGISGVQNTVGFVDSTLANTFGRRLHADVLTGATQALGKEFHPAAY